MNELLPNILSAALWEKSCNISLTGSKFCNLMKVAEQQAVQGLAFSVLMPDDMGMSIDNDEEMEALSYYFVMQREIASQNIRLNRETASLASFLERSGIDYIVVKGQTMACLYPNAGVRTSGDIDFLVSCDYAEVRPLLEREYGVALPQRMLERQVGFHRGKVKFECHTCLRSFGSSRHQREWDEMMAGVWHEAPFYVDIDGVRVRTLPPTENAVYIFVHLFFHFIREGISLRHFCDWTMTLHHYAGAIDRERLSRLLTAIGLTRAYRAFGSVLVDCLGLPEEEFPLPVTADDRKWQNSILTDVLQDGNFGRCNHGGSHIVPYKVETLRITVRRVWKYWRLAPREILLTISRLVRENIKITLKRMSI